MFNLLAKWTNVPRLEGRVETGPEVVNNTLKEGNRVRVLFIYCKLVGFTHKSLDVASYRRWPFPGHLDRVVSEQPFCVDRLNVHWPTRVGVSRACLVYL
jgi:hypothetical protein